MFDKNTLLLLYFQIAALLNTITALATGLFVYYRNKQHPINRAFLIHCCVTTIWGTGYFLWQTSTNAEKALFFCRIMMIGATFMPVTYFHYILLLRNKNSGLLQKLLAFGYIIDLIFISFVFSSFYVASVEKKLFFEYWPVPGKLFSIVFAQSLIYWLSAAFILYKGYWESQDPKNMLLKMTIGSTVLGYIGGFPNYLLWYGFPIAPFTAILVSLSVIVLAYPVVKYPVVYKDRTVKNPIIS